MAERWSDDWVAIVREVCLANPELVRSARTGVFGAGLSVLSVRWRLYHLAWDYRNRKLDEDRCERTPIGELKSMIFDLICEHIALGAVDRLAELVP